MALARQAGSALGSGKTGFGKGMTSVVPLFAAEVCRWHAKELFSSLPGNRDKSEPAPMGVIAPGEIPYN